MTHKSLKNSVTDGSKKQSEMTTQDKINFLMQNYEKDCVSEISKTDVETNKSATSEVISLLEDSDSIIKSPTP
jgi:hypothetical protein